MKRALRLKKSPKNKKNKKLKKLPFVAVTDSGAGGLHVFLKLRRAFPSLNLLYVSDRKNVPYGQKSDGELVDLCKANYKKAKAAGAAALVVACNTMARAGKSFFLSLSEPCFFIEPPVYKISEDVKREKCAVFCTEATARSKALKSLGGKNNCFVFPQKRLAAKIERALYSRAKAYLGANNNFARGGVIRKISIECKIQNPLEIKKVYLCCTHYAYAKYAFLQKFKNAEIYDGTEAAVKAVREFLAEKSLNLEFSSLFLSKTKFLGSGKGLMKRLYYGAARNNLF